ncbi:MAG: hypothetical protein EOP84_12950 [Verrucomicrobiaceae bacterium]|nr:MAG: hypothetical protein EOP84_12950 [Verrucomicrobiaceae bacterium]
MGWVKIYMPLALALLLVACEESRSPEERPDESAPAPVSKVATTAVEITDKPRTIIADQFASQQPDLIPPELTPEAERSEKGARNLLLTFAKAIEFKRFEQAWELLSPADKQKWSKADFTAIFADLSSPSVAVPDGTTEGGAGSIYYNAPITITGSESDGRPVRIEGEAVLRRVNDVDGATKAQLRWHFDTLDLRSTH